MCGIVGFLGTDDFQKYIISGLKLLQNRGYDSAGISAISKIEYSSHKINTIKYASTDVNDSIKLVENEINAQILTGNIAIGHTRWATHGSKTNENAHPHTDHLNRIAIVHNGIIENFKELKDGLIKEGFSFKSQTDTEVISIMIGKYLDKGIFICDAIKMTIEKLTGTWALIVIHKDYPNHMWITRNGSPLLLGMEDNYIMVVSEQRSEEHTSELQSH